MSSKKKLTDTQIEQDKKTRLMELIAWRAGYYRANVHRFCKDYLNINLKLFQKILLWAMMKNDVFYFIASRGLGKTYLVALFAVCRAILYPGSKIVACSYTYKQGREIILKITDDFMQKSPILRTEISRWSTGQNECYVYFKNGSWLRVVVASESSRGARSNCLLIDESRMVPDKIVSTVLRPMNSSPRQPGYLNKPEYSHLQEMNKELFLSSAWFKQSEMYERVKSCVANMLDPQYKFFVVDLPYELSIKEGLLMREQIENEQSEQTFNEIAFMMEREGIFYGSAEDALFDFKVLNDRRILLDAFKDLDYYKSNNIKIPPKQAGEKRILSVDIALMASRKHNNDASALIINSALPTSNNDYISNIVYIDTREGLVTEELGLIIMRYFYQYNCDYLVVDGSGVGQAILDYLMSSDRYDPVFGQNYPALNCCNNDDIASRCKSKNAPKVIYAIKANAKSNNDMCLALRSGFQNGSINLLCDDNNIDDVLSKHIKGYSKLTESQKAKIKLPYIQTSLLIDELINLNHEINNGMVKVKEKSGMRKDRYSSLEYNYYVTQQLALKLKPKQSINEIYNMFQFRQPKKVTRF